MEKKTVLITGASGGIGYEMAKQFAGMKYDLVLVARSEDKLKKIKKELESRDSIHVTNIIRDMTEEHAAEKIAEQLDGKRIQVDMLVNNAGFGDLTGFLEADWERHKRMIDLNVVALMEMTHIFGRQMKERGTGKILNVASVAAFSGGPYMSIYYASKAFVFSFSQAVHEELRESGVTVTVLCPGPTTTDFEKRANMGHSVMFSRFKPASAESVARAGIRAMMKGKPIQYHGFVTYAFNIVSRVFPRKWARLLAKGMDRTKQ